MRPICFAVMVLVLALPSYAGAPPDAASVMRQALLAAQAGEWGQALAKMHAAVALRPNHPIYLYNLACLQSLAGHSTEALATLLILANFGVHMPAAGDADFASIADTAEFKSITTKFRENQTPRGAVTTTAILPAQPGLIEGIAVRPSTGEIFFGDMHQRGVWKRAPDGGLSRFTPDDERVFGVGGLAVDEVRGVLWAACSAQEVMAGWSEATANHSALAGFDLTTGKLTHYYPVPVDGRPHATVDLTLANDGTVYLSDSVSPIIWRLRPDAAQLDAWVDDARFRSLQGLALAADDQVLFVADYALGLFRIDIATGAVAALPPPTGHTLIGIDGLVRDGSRLIAVQNGVRPSRVLAINLDSDGSLSSVDELAAARPEMRDITLGSIGDGQFTLIGDAGWRFFEPDQSRPTAGRSVPILVIDLKP